MAHFACQQISVIKGFLKFRVCVLALNRYAEQSGKPCEKIRVCFIELSGIRTVSFENAEGSIAVTSPSDEYIDRASYAVVSKQLRRSKACLFLQMV